jgi:hypothetical protein
VRILIRSASNSATIASALNKAARPASYFAEYRPAKFRRQLD